MECQEKYGAGTIRGKLLLVPNLKNTKETRSEQGLVRLRQPDLWGYKDEQMLQVHISEESGQTRHQKSPVSKSLSLLTQARPQQPRVFLKHPTDPKVNRSKSFSNSGNNFDTLNLSDSRRYSCASNESVESSTGTKQGFNEHRLEQHSPQPNLFYSPYEDPNRIQKLSQYSDFDGGSLSYQLKDNDQYIPSDTLKFQEKRSSGGGMDSHREPEQSSSGFPFDSEFGGTSSYSRLPAYGSDQDKEQVRQMGLVDSRRESMYSNYSDRRGSEFSSDSDRRDSNTSHSDWFCSSSDNVKSASSSSILNSPSENMCGLREDEEKFPTVSFFNMAKPGMAYVPEWLKSLRLHKYTNMIMSLTYEQMLELDEKSLEKLNVTKGARRKIISSVQKLKDRMRLLSSIDSEIDRDCCDVKKVLTELEFILKSPIKASGDNEDETERVKVRHNSARDSGTEVSGSEDDEEQDVDTIKPGCEGEDLIEKIITSLRKVCSLLILSQNTDLKFVAMFTNLLDICLYRDVYQLKQKQLMLSWKQKILSIWGPLPAPHHPTSSYNKDRKFPPPQPQIPHEIWGSKSLASRQFVPKGERLDFPLQPVGDSSNFQAIPSTNNHRMLLQRKSAPNIQSWQKFSSPVTFKKRSSFQDSPLNMTSAEYQLLTPGSDLYKLPMLTPSSCDYVFNTRSQTEERGVSPSPLDGGNTLVENPSKADDCDAASESTGVVTNIFVTSPESPCDSDLNTRMESLCLSVTEHALN